MILWRAMMRFACERWWFFGARKCIAGCKSAPCSLSTLQLRNWAPPWAQAVRRAAPTLCVSENCE